MKNKVVLAKILLAVLSLNAIINSFFIMKKLDMSFLHLQLLVGIIVFVNIFILVTIATQKYENWKQMVLSNFISAASLIGIATQGLFMYLVGRYSFALTSLVSLLIAGPWIVWTNVKNSEEKLK